MVEVSRFTAGFLRGAAHTGRDLTTIYCGQYDLALLVSSWDKRSVCITEAGKLEAKAIVMLLFTQRDGRGLRDRHDRALEEFAKTRTSDFQLVLGDSLEIHATWTRLLRAIVKCRQETDRPLRIFIDASACPRFYLLGIMATTLGSGLASAVSISYSEAHYPARTNALEEVAFTSGQWKSVAIPGLEGRYSPGLKRFFLVSLGFEGWKTMRAVTRADPDRVSLLHGNPGTDASYASRSLEDNAPLIAHYKVPDGQIVKAPAGDAIAGWRALSEAKLEREDENSYFLCSGTKPHSLSLALRALCLRTPAVLYNLPEAHPVIDIESNRVFWRFDIESLTVPYS